MPERTRPAPALLVLLLLGAALFAAPLYLLVSVSLKSTLGALQSPFSLPVPPQWANYTTVLSGAGNNISIGASLVNSVLLTGVSCVLLVVVGSTTAYVLARNPGRTSDVLYLLTVVAIVIPSQLGIAPLYSWLRELGLVGTPVAVILVYVFKQMPLSIFLYTGFFRRLPVTYEEAAALDGANRLTTFVRVVMPQMTTITGTAILLNALYIWNDLFVQLVFLSGSAFPTLPVAIYTLSFGEVSQWNVIFTGVFISLLPMVVLYLFTQKKMMASFGGGLKG